MLRLLNTSPGDDEAPDILQVLADGVARVVDRRTARVNRQLAVLEDRIADLERQLSASRRAHARIGISFTEPASLALHRSRGVVLPEPILADCARRLREDVELGDLAEEFGVSEMSLAAQLQMRADRLMRDGMRAPYVEMDRGGATQGSRRG